MTAAELISAATAAGIELSVDSTGKSLHYQCPMGALTPEWRAALVQHKAAVLAHLGAVAAAVQARIVEFLRQLDADTLDGSCPPPRFVVRDAVRGLDPEATPPGLCRSCREALAPDRLPDRRCAPCSAAANAAVKAWFAGRRRKRDETLAPSPPARPAAVALPPPVRIAQLKLV